MTEPREIAQPPIVILRGAVRRSLRIPQLPNLAKLNAFHPNQSPLNRPSAATFAGATSGPPAAGDGPDAQFAQCGAQCRTGKSARLQWRGTDGAHSYVIIKQHLGRRVGPI